MKRVVSSVSFDTATYEKQTTVTVYYADDTYTIYANPSAESIWRMHDLMQKQGWTVYVSPFVNSMRVLYVCPLGY